MKRLIWILATCALAAFVPQCSGDDCGLSGSKCGLLNCGFDKLQCQLYASPNDAYKITYTRTLEEGSEYAAIVIIDLIGLEQTSGLQLEGQDCLDRVSIYQPVANNWGDFVDCKLKIKTGGLQAGQSLDGKVSYQFEDGYFATSCFSCTLEDAEAGL